MLTQALKHLPESYALAIVAALEIANNRALPEDITKYGTNSIERIAELVKLIPQK